MSLASLAEPPVSSAAVQPIVAMLRDPVGGDPTQYMVEKAFVFHQLDWRYLTLEVAAADLADAIRGIRAIGFRGGHCGPPHKRAVVPLLDRTTEAAAMIGAVNLIVREDDGLLGENTEGQGLLRAVRRATDLAGRRVVLLGAGNMARAAAIALAGVGVAAITVVNRDLARANALAQLVTEKFEVEATAVAWEGDFAIPDDTDLLIHATSLGDADPDVRLPLVLDGLTSSMTVVDVALNALQTWLLYEASERGCTIIDGPTIHIDQVAIGFELWTGVAPQCSVLREAIEEFLEL